MWLSLVLMISTPEAQAWGPTGHRAVAAIAEDHLSRRTRKALGEILGDDTLVELSTWPDWIRSDPERKAADTVHATWHYVSVEDGQTVAEHGGQEHQILWAIDRAETVLADEDAPRQQRWEALAWLTHLVGDIHQPLHVGRAEDRGGNLVQVRWMGDDVNLHLLWDDGLIDFSRLSYTELAGRLDRPSRVDGSWAEAPPARWAEESKALRGLVYTLGEPDETGRIEVSWDYRHQAWPVVEQRVLQAGLRLAARLDALFGR